nr:PREDICTED: beta-1,3-galactosyltransferase 2-like [Latimeria chalumnae]|eukprot:XP_006011075.1 PREDICTED: beta-1,3-galactosyltransferase 2-like [Latimeria chalumnae]
MVVVCVVIVIVFCVHRNKTHPWEKKTVNYNRQHDVVQTAEPPAKQQRSPVKANFTWKRSVVRHDIVYPYDYIINEPDKCKDKKPFLVLLIPTGAAEVSARNAIRETWGNETLIPGVTIVRLFFLGFPVPLAESLQWPLKEESAVHHDIIQKDFLDTYKNLTIKTMMAMEWLADHCPDADYAMKIDTDMFLNSEKLVKSLLNPDMPTRQNYFTGYLFVGQKPHRDKSSKWYIPEDAFTGDEYPPFCSGTGYVFSVDVVRKILDASRFLIPIYLEDVYIGLCLYNANLSITKPPDSLFHSYYVNYNACGYRNLITSHSYGPEDIIRTWANFQNKKVLCSDT